MRKILILLIIAVILTSCKEVADFYLGIPLQPKFEENSYTDGLNIFGILRCDSTGNFNNSFVEIQKVMPAVGEIDSFEVGAVKVTVEKINSSEENLYNFTLTDGGGVFSRENYRPDTVFSPLPGDIYALTCNYTDFPVLMATTIIPDKANLVSNSIFSETNFFSFEIELDTTFFMIDVYCYSGDKSVFNSRFAAEPEDNTLIEMPVNANSIDSVLVFTYDFNLAKYYLNSNTSLNFNKYRNSYSTVENGYGVFGSINKNVFKIKNSL
jgi:hypothetical protein